MVLAESATSLLFKLSQKMSQKGFLEALHRCCKYSWDKRPYDFVHLPWSKLAVVNFVSVDACTSCFQMMNAVAGYPGVCVAGVRRAANQGLEANLAHFCAKCSQSSTYEYLPLIFVSGKEVPLDWACERFVTRPTLLHFVSKLESERAQAAWKREDQVCLIQGTWPREEEAKLKGCHLAPCKDAWPNGFEACKMIFSL
ncbi:unnamed protein product [Effrenium voratum]|nr:unnamed protein product [Effrenium voratum]